MNFNGTIPAPTETFLEKIFVDTDAIPNDGYGFCQVVFLALAYGYILMQGANLIKDGSELLLLLPNWAGVVGPIVLPVLGAVPDGAIVLFSGMGPDAQSQLSVGIGALAGSTIMLLTVPWFLSMWAGRVNLDSSGSGNYLRPRGAGPEWKKLSPPSRIRDTGVNVGPSIRRAAFLMAATLTSFFVIQIPAIVDRCSLQDQEAKTCTTPRTAALVGGILTVLLFAFYLVDQKRQASKNDDVVLEAKAARVRVKAFESGLVSLAGLFAFAGEATDGEPVSADQALLLDDSSFRKFLKPHFKRWDKDGSGVIERNEFGDLIKALEGDAAADRVGELMDAFDTDRDGSINFDEFVRAMHRILEISVESRNTVGVQQNAEAPASEAGGDHHDEEGDGEEEEEDEIPEDLVGLSPDEQRRRILLRSFGLMGFGTIVVVLFSDPMVDVLSKLGDILHISSFYVAFVLAPMVSNGSELIAAYFYAGKKTESSMTIALATLVGSAAMNNTFCLGIFLFLVYAKDLLWVFTAEITAIVAVEIVMLVAILGTGKTMRIWMAFAILSLFPLSIVLVAMLENVAGLD